MKYNSLHVIFVLAALLFGVVSCQQEELRLDKTKNMGRIVLSNSDVAVFANDVETRATLDNYSGFVFTLNGVTVDGWTVRDSVISFTNNAAIIDAGTYSLSVNNDAASLVNNGCANYSGSTTQNFSLVAGGTTSVSISLGAPKNAKVTIGYSDGFTAKYENVRLTLTAGGRSVNLGNVLDCEDEAFFPAGSVSYTVTATAKSGSHVTDITSASGSTTLVAGKHHVISLTANPVTDEIVPLIEGTHNDYFD